MSILDLFIKQSSEAPDQSEDSSVTEAPVRSKKALGSSPTESTADSAPSKDVEGVAEFLVEAMEAHNPEGFDYLKFHKAMRELVDAGQSEESAIVSTFTTAKMMGMTKAKLLSSGKEYQAILDEEKGKFEAESKAKHAEDVEAREREAQDLLAQIDTMKTKAEKLTKEAAKAKEQINRLSFAFTEAHTALSGKMQAELKKISSCLKEGK